MSCSNCYNGCTDIVSDKCIRYTGIDVPVLGIKTGDSLSYVEQALIEFLTAAIDGTGIIPIINPATLCDLVENNLPTCGDISLNDVLDALIKSACSLQTQIGVINNTLNVLNADYTIGCLTGVTASSDTHAILQAVITKLCATDVALAALAANLSTNYVRLDELDVLIQEYLDSQAPSNRYYNKMVPYTVVEYYGTLANFNGAGVGIGQWEKIYLCNGANGTPDKRGRIGIGTLDMYGGGPLGPEVSTAGGNFNYTLNSTNGINNVTLSLPQIPSHTHIAVPSVNDPGHTHTYVKSAGTSFSYGSIGSNLIAFAADTQTGSKTTGITIGVVNSSAGGGQSHTNVPTVRACYYIMYIPS
jgi:microcystin-dependent protein